MSRLRDQQGLTILELIIVLIVAGLIMAAVWIAYSSVNRNDRVTRTVSAIDKTAQAARDYLASQPTVPPALSTNLYTPTDLMPSELTFKGGTSILSNVNAGTQVFRSPLGYDFFVQSVTGNTNIFEVRIGLTNISGKPPGSICLALIPKLIGNMNMVNERGIVGWQYSNLLSGTTATTNGMPSGISDGAAPLTSAQQQSACATANDLHLYYSIRP